MKKGVLLICLFFTLGAFAQPTIDGDMSDASYTTVGTYTSGQDGFGSDNDLGAIRYHTDGTNIYVGITGEIASDNNIVVFFNFSGYGGRNAGDELDPFGNYEGYVGVFNKGNNSGLDYARMDMGVDFGLAFNKGNAATNLYVDAIRYGSSDVVNNNAAGNVASQTGTSGTVDVGTTFGGTGNMTLAFDNGFSGDVNKGIEFSIPLAAFSGVDNSQTVELFAIITNATGYMSNECIPGDPGSSNLENDANLSAIGGQDFFTTAASLPVEFTKFSATPRQKEIALNWQTATEKNNSHFEIEKSVDGKNYYTIGEVSGAGTTLEVQNYEFMDVNPANGMNYYRLKQVDWNDDSEYSNITAVEFSSDLNAQFFPNPVKNELTINATTQDVSIFIYSMTGQLVKQVNDISIDGQYNLNMSELMSGIYQVQIIEEKTGNLLTKQRVVKQ
jgi:hypothetical protein